MTRAKKYEKTTDGGIIIHEYPYKPSPEAQEFHNTPHRFRYLIWGIKSGKSFCGAFEAVNFALQLPQSLGWAVGPTFGHLQVCEREIAKILHHPTLEGVLVKHNRGSHEFHLVNGSIIQMKSAELPDNLRGPNLDYIWIDEAGFVKNEAWWICEDRVAATGGEIFCTTTPNDRNWIWNEILAAGMPGSAPFGVWGDSRGEKWVSHYPTEQFPWVPKEYIAEKKKTKPAAVFERDYMAKFVANSRGVFRRVQESLGRIPLTHTEGQKFVLGLDLAKAQDFTSEVVMDGQGNVHSVRRWSGVDWIITKARVEATARKYDAAIMVDKSNIGSVIEEDLRHAGLNVHPVDMNSPQVKNDLIQALQVAMESYQLNLPDPKSEFSQEAAKYLMDELEAYEARVTRFGRISFSAPSGQHDDLVIGLALANWGRIRGLAGGGITASSVSIGRDQFKMTPKKILMRRPRIFGNIFGNRRSTLGMGGSGPFWG